MMTRTNAPRHAAPLLWLGITIVSFVTLTRGGAGLVNSHLKTHSRALQDAPVQDFPIGYWKDIGKHAELAGERNDDKPGAISWLEKNTAGDAQRTATGQLTTRWQRVARRLGFGKRNREVAESAGTVPAKRRSTWAGKIAQHMRRAGALLRRKLPAYFSGLRTRIRNWWRGMPDVVRFQPEEPGDALVARLLAELRGIGGRPQDIKWEHGAFDDCVSSTFFPPDAPVQVVSEITGSSRTFVRGPPLGTGGFGIVFLARDVETNEEVVLKAAIKDGVLAETIPASVQKEAFFYRQLPGVKTPEDAHLHLRLLVAADVVKVAHAPATKACASGNWWSSQWVPNLFLVMPKAETDLERLTTTSFEEGPTVSESELGRAARLQLSIGIIQTVANLHDQGLVHVDIKPGNFVVMSDGRLFLSDYGSCEKLGTVRMHVGLAMGYLPPEFTLSGGVHYAQAFDAWQVGLSLYVLWCKDRPEGIGRGVVLDFSKCPVDPPEAIKDLIRWFLQKDEGLRLLPLRAMRTRQFRQIKKEVERSLRHFAIQPPLETGEETQSVKLEQASLAEATERPGERGMTDTMSTGVEA
ncbi:rhoptry protein ROP18 [Besnoitia besnoiti]|uniref:Rhoptry protein ROP18 n=1 Tax=Besnoitia besnoiti TaxID=94643 RepID=A0A2A9M536_BESBE|nr:rhoptry protein ROP18 [Besnoitia besnoiti]XP_029215039.1 rhoptry protein ROP18 [Besnoitia besnoiti]PFH31026.1 rhoptry protein ROP18 [Besnoitia besnoiti]PFH31029.1 rhoptry protein ROP18 [Besnoitia besnoiti]